MTYNEVKHSQRMHADREALLGFVHAVLTHAIETGQHNLSHMAHQTLDRLQVHTVFLPIPKTHYGA